MNTSTKILDALRAKLNLPSDYAVAKYLGHTTAAVGHWRTGRTQMSYEIIKRVAPILGEDAAELAATIEAERAQNETQQEIMQALADSRVLETLIASGAVKVDRAAVRAAVAAMGDKLTPGVLNAYFWHRDYVFQAAAEVSQLRRRLSAIEALDLRSVRAVGVVRLGDLADALSDGERSAAARMQALQEALRA